MLSVYPFPDSVTHLKGLTTFTPVSGPDSDTLFANSVTRFKEGDYFGESSVFPEDRCGWLVRAVTPMQLFSVRGKDFLKHADAVSCLPSANGDLCARIFQPLRPILYLLAFACYLLYAEKVSGTPVFRPQRMTVGS